MRSGFKVQKLAKHIRTNMLSYLLVGVSVVGLGVVAGRQQHITFSLFSTSIGYFVNVEFTGQTKSAPNGTNV